MTIRITTKSSKNKFVLGLMTSPDKMEEFKINPVPAMKEAGLTRKEMALILSRCKDDVASNAHTKAFRPHGRAARRGSLTIVGTGIKGSFQISPESVSILKLADKVFYVVADQLTESWIRKLQPTARSLKDCYAEGKSRKNSYAEMVRIILGEVRKGSRVCVAFYGHPGVGCDPSSAAIKRARSEGFDAHLRPGISAEDCLFADLGLDPIARGCQSFEATDFLLHKRVFDPRSALILWQVGVIGNDDYRASGRYDLRSLSVLQEVLLASYPPNHKITLYLAPATSLKRPVALNVRLSQLSKTSLDAGHTMYVPPLKQAAPDRDMFERLGLCRSRSGQGRTRGRPR